MIHPDLALCARDTRPAPEGGLRFSVIVPLEFHRGQAQECIRGWTQEQTWPREQFEVLVASPGGFPKDELARLRALLSDRDRVLLLQPRHDMGLCAEAALKARGEALFFTEAHCLPEAETLARADAALRAHPEWAGFSCRSVPVTHNLLSQVEAELYEKDIDYAMNQHPWRKVLDQCFVVRRREYFQAGGFEPELGHFAEWLLAARFFELGLKIGYVPEARIHHYYIGRLGEWREFTQDFAEGQMRFLAREASDRCHGLFEEVPQWLGRHHGRRAIARGVSRMLWRDQRSGAGEMGSASGVCALAAHYLYWNWRQFALWACRAAAGHRAAVAGATLAVWHRRWRLAWHLATGNKERAQSAILAFCEALVNLQRERFLRRWAREWQCSQGDGILRQGTPECAEGVWEPGDARAFPAVGFHMAETAAGGPFRWSEPAALVELPLPVGSFRIEIEWLAVRPRGEMAPRFYFNERRVPSRCVRLKEDRVELSVANDRPGTVRIGWICRPWHAPHDRRSLGLPIRRVCWHPDAPAAPAPALPAAQSGAGSETRLPDPTGPARSARRAQHAPAERPLLFMHIRKTAGCSVRNLLLNRFNVGDCLIDAHHVGNALTDPSNYRFVTGHVGYDYVERFSRRPVILTVLRQPIDRALSAYFFFRANPEEFLQWLRDTLPPEVAQERVRFTRAANELTLPAFLRQESALGQEWLGNAQTRQLLGAAGQSGRTGSDAELLAEAKRTLESCDVVGLTDRLQDSMALLEHQLGWEGLGPIPRENAMPGRPAIDEIEPEALDILVRWNMLDAELYLFAQQLLERRLRQMSMGDTRSGSPDRLSRQTRLPDGTAFTFDQAIHGHGWYLRERYGDGWICWMGKEAWIDLAVEGDGERRLQCCVAHVLRSSVLDGLQVRVNGEPLNIRRRTEGASTMIEAAVPARILEAGSQRVRIAFSLAETVRPRDLVPGSPDPRVLGMALAGVRLLPAAPVRQ